MLNTTDFNTFWHIISSIGIEIPAIQRDYAQGRGTGRIPQIRRKFITSLVDALRNEEYLRLDFVFGKIFGIKNQEEIQKNQKAIQNLLNSIKSYADSVDLVVGETPLNIKGNQDGETIYLIPLDGQQRLTALFLLHWYVFQHCKQMDKLHILRRFRYKTRKSTELFIEMLCIISIDFSFKGQLSEQIKDLELFSNTWLDDPTVESMLVVLDEIHLQFNSAIGGVDFTLIMDRLIEHDFIYFDFLNLQNFGLSDELYVKMNSRGRSLTDFENFKAWLFGKINLEDLCVSESCKEHEGKFDVEWNDIFWKYKSDDIFEIDIAYLNFFKVMYLLDLVKTCPLDKSAFQKGRKLTIIELITSDQKDFDFENIFDDEFLLEERFVKKLPLYFNTLDVCSNKSLQDNDSASVQLFFKYFFNYQQWQSWPDLLKNYIVLSFIQYNSDKLSDSYFYHQYIRVLTNLINNQRFDTASRYKGLLLTVDRINQHIKETGENILEWLIGLDLDNANLDLEANWVDKNSLIFTKEQLAEEIYKAHLIINDNTDSELIWQDLLEKAETHEYFSGKISFLLHLSNSDKKLFQEYFQKIAPLFSHNILNDESYLVQRALLTFGNYFVQKNNNKVTFCKNDRNTFRERSENWFSVFMNHEKITLIKSLVNSRRYDFLNVNASLHTIIEEYIIDNPIEKFVKAPFETLQYHHFYIYEYRLFKYGTSRLIQLDGNFKYGYQLNATNTGGYFCDNICQFIKYKYFDSNDEIHAIKTKNWNNSPTLVFKENSYLKLVPLTNKFEFVENEIVLRDFNTISEVVRFIESY